MGSSEAPDTIAAVAPAPKPLLGPAARRWIAGLMVLVGVQCWLILGQGVYGLVWQLELLLIAVVVALIPPVNRFVFSILDRIRNPSQRSATIVACIISIASACYFPITAWRQGRHFLPGWQDEGSYAIQIRMLSQGRLWMPAHPLADFFDSFQVIIDPVYASMYFPGASLFYVPAAWVGLPYWIVSCAIAGACVGLVYLIITELIDGVAGALAALMLVALSEFRALSTVVAGHPAIILLCMLMIFCWLHWRKTRSPAWAAALGVVSGWAAISRPLDALIFALPIGLDMLLILCRAGAHRRLVTFAAIFICAVPFLAIQIVFNFAVAGSWHRTPFEHYADRDYPGTTLGFHKFDPQRRPVSKLPQKQRFHDEWTIPAIQRHQPQKIIRNWLWGDHQYRGELPQTLATTLPHPLLIFLLPAALLGLGRRTRWIFAATFPLWIILYTFYTWILLHYAIVIAPAVIFLALLGARELETAWLGFRRPIGACLTVAIIVLSITQLPEFNRTIIDDKFETGELARINSVLAKDVKAPAVVLFHFGPQSNPHIEPVYNFDTAWPDDAPIIRAHDLGPRNIELFRYYAQLQPQRTIYLYDRGDRSLRELGLAKDLADAIDFDKTADDYATHRVEFAPELFERLGRFNVGTAGQRVLDLAAGTGLLARQLSKAGCRVTLADVSHQLLIQSDQQNRIVAAAEELPLMDESFDVVTAAQCWHWFDRRRAPREILRVLGTGGSVAVVYQMYVPMPGSVAQATESLILKHRPGWRHANSAGINGQVLRDLQSAGFIGMESFSFDVDVAFTRESWRGFIRTTSPIGASMTADQIETFDRQHAELLESWTEPLRVPHRIFAAVARKPVVRV